MFGNRVLREISGFGPNSVELIGGRIKLHNVEFNDLYFQPDIVRVIKWRRMKWAGHEARMGRRHAYRVLMGKPGVRRPFSQTPL
jgi:hypothetical protein